MSWYWMICMFVNYIYMEYQWKMVGLKIHGNTIVLYFVVRANFWRLHAKFNYLIKWKLFFWALKLWPAEHNTCLYGRKKCFPKIWEALLFPSSKTTRQYFPSVPWPWFSSFLSTSPITPAFLPVSHSERLCHSPAGPQSQNRAGQ